MLVDAFFTKGQQMKIKGYFSKTELILWCTSVFIIIVSFFIFDRESYMTLSASLIGVTSLIFNAKGNPFGQLLMVVFSLMYGMISLSFAYYGEMITYLGMTMPMAVFALVAWMKNPYNGNKAQVKVNSISKAEAVFMWVLAAAVTFVFYYILLYTPLFQHCQPLFQHTFRYHKLCCGISHIQKKSALCAGICGKRYCAHCSVDNGKSS